MSEREPTRELRIAYSGRRVQWGIGPPHCLIRRYGKDYFQMDPLRKVKQQPLTTSSPCPLSPVLSTRSTCTEKYFVPRALVTWGNSIITESGPR